jgi:Domain of unknown function (DUF4390)
MTRTLRRFLSALVMLMAGLAHADTIEVLGVGMEPVDEGYVVHADFWFELSSRLEEALANGVSLNFMVEFELVRPRWYWFDETAASEKLQVKLSYLPLSQQYTVASGPVQQSFSSLGEALRVLGRIRSWPVMGRDRITAGRSYVGSIRMRLDTSQLPKAVQVMAMTTRDWSLASEWRHFTFVPSEKELR